MSSVIASNIPTQVTPAKVREFFSFCGKITDLVELENDGKVKKYEVIFQSPKAVSTALLLNDAELDNTFIRVDEVKEITDGGNASATTGGAATGGATTSTTGGSSGDAILTGDKTYDDVDQEDKPKYAILAQLLADGYVVSDSIIERGAEFDKKNGISEKFNNFIKGLDEKYVHSADPNSAVNQQIEKATDSYNKSSLKKYFDDAADSALGRRIVQYYKNFSNDVKDVHAEAVRLAKIKKEKEASGAGATSESATGTATTGTDTTPTVKA